MLHVANFSSLGFFGLTFSLPLVEALAVSSNVATING